MPRLSLGSPDRPVAEHAVTFDRRPDITRRDRFSALGARAAITRDDLVGIQLYVVRAEGPLDAGAQHCFIWRLALGVGEQERLGLVTVGTDEHRDAGRCALRDRLHGRLTQDGTVHHGDQGQWRYAATG